MDQERERVLRQLQELIDKGGDADAVYRVMREALGVRPVPHDLLRTLLRRQAEAGRAAVAPEELAERQEQVRRHWDEITHPSPRAADPEHAIGAAANALKAALPEFQERPAVPVDFETAKLWVRGQEKPTPAPPELAEGRPFSCWRMGRGLLIQDESGSVFTQFELFRHTSSRQELEASFRRGLRISDTLTLSWLRPKPLELREVEALLRRLADAVLPGTCVSFSSYDEPQYRWALRMQIADLPIPGAIGGVLNPRPEMPNDVELASVPLYLESWASARSGQAIGLAESPFPLSGSK